MYHTMKNILQFMQHQINFQLKMSQLQNLSEKIML